jgi:hypothetical protein
MTTYAALGPEFKFHQRPHSVCAIEFFVSDKKETLTEVCSAVVIGPKLMLTAAHCTPNLPDRPHKIICRNGVQTQVEKAIKNKKVQLERLRFGDREHKNDTGLLELTQKITTPNMQVRASRIELETLLNETNKCGLFGFGGFHHQDRKKGHSTSAQVDPDQIEFDGDLIRINGFKNRASGLVEPGDSGGSLACLNPKDQHWVHIAQISGRTMQGVSLLAPVYLFKDELLDRNAFDYPIQGSELKDQWQKNDELLAIQHCQKVLERSGARDIEIQNYGDCQRKQSEYIKDQFFSGREIKVRLKNYSLVELDQRKEMINLNGQRDPERLFQKENPFTTVDHDFNQFTVTNITGDSVTGDLKIFGYSENFGCSENILCDGGDYKNIKISIDALSLPLLK